ncbi:hypothetical protein PVAND_016051 [Polypedilum vanderplanki]|uniref:C2H2-type domain-containing protein n=1 Tax=Polypedilum vanderplanki TaxID=319348 RepID=A0A9J6BDZ6_POLVA|nr:hypothetical protein PVAND_016051 [Polypedilum vanderplanki]
MTSKCSIPNCCLQSSFTFHSPRNRTHLELWKKILNIKEDSFYVCDLHFEDKFLRIEKRLTVDAFPTQCITNIEPGSQNFCQCCLKSFEINKFLTEKEKKYPIDKKFKEEFLEVIGFEIDNGVACSKCYEYIKEFQKFRNSLREKQKLRTEILKNQEKMNLKNSKISSTEKSEANIDFDPNIKIKEEPKDDDEILKSVIDVQQESFSDSMLEIKEEIIEENVIVKQEPLDENVLVSEIKAEPEEMQGQPIRRQSIMIKKILPNQSPKIVIRKPQGGIIVKPVNLKNLKIIQPIPSQKFQIIKQAPTPSQIIKFQPLVNSLNEESKNSYQSQTSTLSSNGFKCQYCPNRFVERRFVVEHIKQKHAYKCDMCPSVFPFRITLIKHRMSLHAAPAGMEIQKNPQNFKFTCNVCASRFSTQENLKIHMSQKHSSVVKKELEKKENENVVFVVKTVPSTSLQINQTTIKTLQPVNTLIKKILKPANITNSASEAVQEDPDGIPCLDCGLLLRPDNLLRHRMDAHSLNTHHAIYTCDLCGIEIKGKTQLINHMTNKHLAKYFVKCEFCEGLFANQTEVICHKNLQHNFNGTRYTCHFCNKIFSNKRDMILHRKQHYSEKESREKLARIFCKKFKSYEPKSEEY